MADNKINVGGRLHSIATSNVLTGANEIFDDDKNKKQSEINTETYVLINDVNERLSGLSPEQQSALSVATKVTNNETKLGYYVCDTEGNLAAKVISDATGYILSKGGSIKVKMINANSTSDATLNINSTGAKPLYYNGERASTNNSWEANETVEIYYDGTNYQANNIAGCGKFSTGEKVDNVGIDSEPTAGSDNLVKSGGVHRLVMDELGKPDIKLIDFDYISGSPKSYTTIIKKLHSGAFHLQLTIDAGTIVADASATNSAIILYVNDVVVFNVAQNQFASYELPWSYNYDIKTNEDVKVAIAYRLNGSSSLSVIEEGNSVVLRQDDIVNNLNSGGSDKVLSAEQGKILSVQTSVNKDNIKSLIEGNNSVELGFFNSDNTATISGNRGLNMPAPCNIQVERILLNGNPSCQIKIYELSKIEDGVFNVVREITEGAFAVTGKMVLTAYPFILHKGNYVAVRISSGSLSYVTDIEHSYGLDFSSSFVVGENIQGTPTPYNIDIKLIGRRIGIDAVSQDLTDILNGGVSYNYANGDSNVLTGSYQRTSNGITTWINGYPVGKTGTIKKIKFYSDVVGYISFYKAKKLNDNDFNVEGLIGVYKTTLGLNEVDCSCPLSKDDYIATMWLVTSQLASASLRTWRGYSYQGTSLGTITPTLVLTESVYMELVIDESAIIERSVIGENKSQNAYLYDSTKQTTDWVSESSGWTNFATTTANSMIWLNKPTGITHQVLRVELNLVDVNSCLVICGHPYTAPGGASIKASYFKFDFENKLMSIHRLWNGVTTTSEPAVTESLAMFDTLYQNHRYVLEVEMCDAKTFKMRLTDCITLEQKELIHINTSVETDVVMFYNYPFGLLAKKGSIQVTRASQYSGFPVKPTLMIYGDSFCQGWNLIRYGYDSDDCYTYKIMEYLGENHFALSARGGEGTIGLLTKKDSDFELFRPKYTLIAVGLNDDIVYGSTFGDFIVNMSECINTARKYGSEIILANYSGNSQPRTSFSSWMSYALGFRILDVQRALASGNGLTTDANKMLADGHPNVVGNECIFNMFKLYFADLLADRN